MRPHPFAVDSRALHHQPSWENTGSHCVPTRHPERSRTCGPSKPFKVKASLSMPNSVGEKNPADLKVVIRHYRCDAISSSTQQPNLLFRHVLLPKSSSLPPTPKPVLRGCGDHWLRATLLKCFRLLDFYGASSGTNYLEHYSTPLPTQCLCVQSKVRLAYNHTAMHWSTPCHCKRHNLGACKGRVKKQLENTSLFSFTDGVV